MKQCNTELRVIQKYTRQQVRERAFLNWETAIFALNFLYLYLSLGNSETQRATTVVLHRRNRTAFSNFYQAYLSSDGKTWVHYPDYWIRGE